MNNLATSVALATAPASAFEELRERPRFWFPLLLLLLTTAGLLYWYYSTVDIEWLKDVMFSNDPRFLEKGEEQRAMMMAALTRSTMLWSTMIFALAFLPIIFVVQALYLLLAAKVTKLPQGFKHWFALVCWCSLPTLLGTVVAAILMFLSDTPQMSPSLMQQLSVNELLVHVPPGGRGYALLSSLHIPGLLSWALMVLGVRSWSQRSWLFSAAYILLPVVVIYGVWGFFAFR